MASADHHHGEAETGIYIVSGHPVFVFLEDGAERRIETGPGDYIYVPPYTNHQSFGTKDSRIIVMSNRIIKDMGFDWHDQLENAPGFDKDHWPSMADQRWAEDVHAFYRRFYGPNNTVLTLVGDLTPEELAEIYPVRAALESGVVGVVQWARQRSTCAFASPRRSPIEPPASTTTPCVRIVRCTAPRPSSLSTPSAGARRRRDRRLRRASCRARQSAARDPTAQLGTAPASRCRCWRP